MTLARIVVALGIHSMTHQGVLQLGLNVLLGGTFPLPVEHWGKAKMMSAGLGRPKNRPTAVNLTRLFMTNGAIFCVYALVAFGSLRLFATLNASVSPVWPPTGLAIAALLLWGPRLWPSVFFGALAANLLTTGTPATSTVIAVGNTLEALTAWFLVSRLGNGLHVFQRGRTLTVFVLGAGVVAPLLSATIGVTSLALAGLVEWPTYFSVWIT